MVQEREAHIEITIPIAAAEHRGFSPAPGASLRPSADLSSASDREELSPAAIREFRRITERWKLTEELALGLLGGVASSTYHGWRSNPKGKKLDQDTLTRISLVIGIYQALHAYFGDPWADRWISSDNRAPMFSGRSPIDFILREGLPGLIQIRKLVEGWGAGH